MIKIFIDQGHNPRNPNSGAEGNGLQEADLTYKIGIRVRDLLNADPGFDSVTSRTSPDEILGTSNASSLSARTRAANEWGADWFISLHCNASDNAGATGSEGYVYSLSSPAYAFSQSILKGLYNVTGTVSRGVFARPTLYVLRKTAMPATLIEMGFITNPGEAAKMNNDPASYAQGIYNGIVDFFK